MRKRSEHEDTVAGHLLEAISWRGLPGVGLISAIGGGVRIRSIPARPRREAARSERAGGSGRDPGASPLHPMDAGISGGMTLLLGRSDPRDSGDNSAWLRRSRSALLGEHARLFGPVVSSLVMWSHDAGQEKENRDGSIGERWFRCTPFDGFWYTRDRRGPILTEILTDPYPFHHELREAGPVVWLGSYGVWATGRYEQVREVLTDWRTFMSGAGVGLTDLRVDSWRPPSLLLEADPPARTRRCAPSSKGSSRPKRSSACVTRSKSGPIPWSSASSRPAASTP